MLSRKEKEALKKVLGHKVASFTQNGKTYTVFNGEDGWECSCPDFIFRKGSYKIIARKDGEVLEVRGCKHIAHVLKERGYRISLIKLTLTW